MSEQSAARPRGGLLTWALWGAAAIGVAGVVYIIAQSSRNPAQPQAAGAPPPDYAVTGPDGQLVKLADFRGKVVVMNLWATWCGPCKEEMPTLAKLQAAYAGKPVEVVEISIDSPEDAAKAKQFIGQYAPLKFYQDPAAKLPFVLTPPAQGTPITVIYGKDGREISRKNGASDWTSPEVKREIDKALAAD
jgi:thiol-disulfide isomerase/thioredoxin